MASGGAGAPSAPAAPAFATSGDVESAGKCVGSIAAIVTGRTPAAGAFFLSLFSNESTPSIRTPKGTTALGKLSDPDVCYFYDKYDEIPYPEDTSHPFIINFWSSHDGSELGEMVIHILSLTHLHLHFIHIEDNARGTGLGKKCMAILEDIAKRKEIKLITLDAWTRAVSFYLGLTSPYTIANNANGAKKAKFNEVYTKRIQNGYKKSNASAEAGVTIMDNHRHVKMTKTLTRKNRTNRKNRKSRKNRKGKRK